MSAKHRPIAGSPSLLLRVREAAALMAVSERQVWVMIRAKSLTPIRPSGMRAVRIARADIEALVSSWRRGLLVEKKKRVGSRLFKLVPVDGGNGLEGSRGSHSPNGSIDDTDPANAALLPPVEIPSIPSPLSADQPAPEDLGFAHTP